MAPSSGTPGSDSQAVVPRGRSFRLAGRTSVTRSAIFCNLLRKASFKCPSTPLGPIAQSRRQSEWRIIVKECARRACVRYKSGYLTAALPVLPRNVISRRALSPPAIRRAMRLCALSPVSMNGQSHNPARHVLRRRGIRRLWLAASRACRSKRSFRRIAVRGDLPYGHLASR